jgi:hypothetical protein
MQNFMFLCSFCIYFSCTSLVQGVDGSGPYGPNPDLDRPPMDESGIGPDPSAPDSGKASHPMASGKDLVHNLPAVCHDQPQVWFVVYGPVISFSVDPLKKSVDTFSWKLVV